jgi:arginase
MDVRDMSKFLESKTIGIVGVVIKEGQGLEGPEKAPEVLRHSGLLNVIKSLDWEYLDYGDVNHDNIHIEEKELKEIDQKEYHYHNLKNAYVIGAANKKLNSFTKKIAESKQFCLTLGGDHGIATGSISGLKAVYTDLKIIWVDAHADCNIPEDSLSGNYHGMPVAHLLGWIPNRSVPGFDWFKSCINSEDIVFIGLRDVDPKEKKNLKKHNIKCFSMHEVIKYGIGAIVEKSIEYLFKDGKEHPIHVSFDVDGIDPSFAYGTGTKARGGLMYSEALYLLRELKNTSCLVSLDLVEINPLLDKPKEKFHGDNSLICGTETVSLGIELVASALGHSYL